MTNQPVVPGVSLTEYFRGLIAEVLEHRQIEANPGTQHYLVGLLDGFARADELPLEGEPLGVRLCQALRSASDQQRVELQQIGDSALFVSGYFSDSLRRALVDVDYYVKLGGYAYGSLRERAAPALAEVFEELSQRFAEFTDVLAEVSERGMMTSNTDLLRLYERWLFTGSERVRRLLTSRGIPANRSLRFVRVQ